MGSSKRGPKQVLHQLGSAVLYVSVEDARDCGIASAFHLGQGWFATARHVVEHRKIKKIGRLDVTAKTQKTYAGTLATTTTFPAFSSANISPPIFHSDPKVDVAIFQCEEFQGPEIRLELRSETLAYNEFLLEPVLVLGYPPIPFSKEPFLVCIVGEVAAVIEPYHVGRRHFIISGTPRGGFSGGVALTLNAQSTTLGVITESLHSGDGSPESGFLSVVSAEAVKELLLENQIPI